MLDGTWHQARSDSTLHRPSSLIIHDTAYIVTAHTGAPTQGDISPGTCPTTWTSSSRTSFSFDAFLVHFFDKNIHIVRHSFEVLSQELVLSFQVLLLFVVLKQRLFQLR